MHWSSTLKRGRYFAPDEKGGGSATEEKTEETEEAKVEETTDETKTESEETKTEEAEEETKTEDEVKTEEPKVRELTDEEIAEKAKALGFVKPEEKKEEPVIRAGLEVRDFRSEAADQVAADPNAKTNGWIDDEGDLTPEGQGVAENHALVLAADHRLNQNAEAEMTRQLVAQKPSLTLSYTDELKQKLGVDEAIAPEIAKTMTEILVDSYGIAAFDEGERDTDPQVIATKKAHAQRLRTTAFYVARGMKAHAEDMARKEGGDAGDKPGEKPADGGTGGNLYAGLDAKETAWLKNEWAKERNGGKAPTKEQIERLKAEGVIG